MTERALEAGDPGEQPALGASRPGQPSRQSVFADPLVGWPRLASGAGDGEAHSSQTLPGGEIGDLESRIDHPGPQVPWHLLIRWDARFGEMPVPLGPNRGLVAGKIQSLDGRAALPTTVRWREPSSDRVGSASCTMWHHHRRCRMATASTSRATLRQRRALPGWR
jgi:hypothetical protein